MAKLKQYNGTISYYGENLELLVVTTSKKRATELMNVDTAFMNKYCSISVPRTQEAIDNPEKVFGRLDSGLAFKTRRDLFMKILPADELKSIIKDHKATKHI